MARDTTNPKEIRDQLAQSVLGRIYFDQKRVDDHQVCDLLRHFSMHLFDPKLRVEEAYKAYDIPNNFAPVFRAQVGDNPHDYLLARRIEVACKLLMLTDIEIYDVGLLAGYGTGQAFSQGFKRAKRMRPKTFRIKYQGGVENTPGLDADLCDQIRRFSAKEAEAYRDFLYSVHPELLGDKPRLRYQLGKETYSPTEYRVSDGTLEQLLAERLWNRIQGMDEATQRRTILEQRFETPALFEYLKKKSLTEGRIDRKKGLHIAWLALDAATSSEQLERGRGVLHAIAWAWIGNAQRLMLRFQDAEHSFDMTEKFMPIQATPDIRGEVYHLKASFKWYQHRLTEGLEISNQSIKAFEKVDNRIGMAKALLVRGILLTDLRHITEAKEDFFRVLLMFAGEPESELPCLSSFNLSYCHWLENDFESAREMLRALKPMTLKGKLKGLRFLIGSLEGRLALDEQQFDEAISHLDIAYSGFQSMNSRLYSLVGLSLAIAYFQKGQIGKAFDYLGETLDTVEVWIEEPEFERVYTRLKHAVITRKLTLDDLVQLQKLCDRFSHLPDKRAQIGLKGMV